MKFSKSFPSFALNLALIIVAILGCSPGAQAQATPSPAVVPQLVNYSGKVTDAQGKTIAGIAGISFAIYRDQYEASPLWMETQNVTADSRGNYTVQLGAGTSNGLPLDVFTSGEARWLGVRINGGEEQPRVLLLSVPYALKAADAQTLGGLPASAFVLAAPPSATASSAEAATATTSAPQGVPPPNGTVTGSGTLDFLPLWDSSSDIVSSVLFQSGTGSTAKIGINTTTPASTLDVKGGTTVRGALSLVATGNATSAGGKNSQPEKLTASSFNSTTKAAVGQTFQWQAEPTGNNTGTPSGTLNLLFGSGSSTSTETGLNIAANGQIAFATGQTFPGTGTITGITTASGSGLTGGVSSGTANLSLLTSCTANQVLKWNGSAWACTTIGSSGGGTVTSVGLSAPSSDFTVAGSPVTKSGTLGLNWTVAPTSSATANAIVKRDASGSFSAGLITATASNAGEAAITANGSTGTAVFAMTSGYNAAVDVVGANTAVSAEATGYGVYSVGGYGVYATDTGGSSQVAVYGDDGSTDTGGKGVWGQSTKGIGVLGSGGIYGVSGYTKSGFSGVYGVSNDNAGVYGYAYQAGWGVYGQGDLGATGVLAGSDTGYAGWFNGMTEVDGNLNVAGTLTADTKDFTIDHPLDPANKYLEHASVESSELMNIYTGNVTTDAHGEATVRLPDWFEALNSDFRYQLTVIGQFAQAIVAHEIQDHEFQIKTSLPNVKVSWQVTGVRQDAYAKAHPLQVEKDKPDQERGFYRHPELYGAPEEKSIAWARDPRAMKQFKEARTNPPAPVRPAPPRPQRPGQLPAPPQKLK